MRKVDIENRSFTKILYVMLYLFLVTEVYGDSAVWQRLEEKEKTAYIQGYIDGVCYLLTTMYDTNPLWYYGAQELKDIVEKYYMDDKNEKAKLYESIFKALFEMREEE